MRTYIVALLLSAVIAYVLTPLLRNLAHRLGHVDPGAEARKVHDTPIPRVGGVALAVAFFIPIFGLFFLDNLVSEHYLRHADRFAALVGGGLVMVGLGLVDDLRGVRATIKLAVQVAVALAAYFLGYQVLKIANPFGDPLVLGWLSLPITVLWIVGIVNAINLIDGLDGLATGIALFTVAILFTLGVVNRNITVSLTSIALAGALIGFLRYNFNPASIFMGDSGSLFLGYVLSVTAISGSSKSSTVVALAIPLLAMGLPVMDTTLTVLRRFLGGRRLFTADRGHVHHRLLDLGLTHRQAVLVLYGACAFLGVGALSLVYANSMMSAVILTIMTVGAMVAAWRLGYLSPGEMRQTIKYGLQRNRTLVDRLAEIQAAADRIRAADNVDDALDALVQLAAEIDVDRLQVHMSIGSPDGVRRFEAEWPRRRPGERTELHRLEYPLDWNLRDAWVSGALSFEWNCPEERILLPETGAYDWLTMVLRDRVLEIVDGHGVRRVTPRLAAPRKSSPGG